MAHFPVNHRLRSVYRALAACCGLYILVFGIVALTRAGTTGFFAQSDLPTSLGLRGNSAFAVLSIVVGLVIVVSAVLGGNLDRTVNLVAGTVFVLAGFAMMVLLRTHLNLLGFTMTTCIVSFIIGLVLALAGLYGRVGHDHEQDREERFRHGVGPDPQEHAWGAQEVPRSRAGVR